MRDTILWLLPKLNAGLNATSGICLVFGVWNIRRRRRETHRRFMLAACTASLLFLVGYVTRVIMQGTHTFPGSGALRTAYLAILTSHMILAVAVLPMVVVTLWFALKGRFDKHPRLARITFPIWLYVSVTGVIVYVMLYHIA